MARTCDEVNKESDHDLQRYKPSDKDDEVLQNFFHALVASHSHGQSSTQMKQEAIAALALIGIFFQVFLSLGKDRPLCSNR